jgi:hypothetical protein
VHTSRTSAASLAAYGVRPQSGRFAVVDPIKITAPRPGCTIAGSRSRQTRNGPGHVDAERLLPFLGGHLPQLGREAGDAAVADRVELPHLCADALRERFDGHRLSKVGRDDDGGAVGRSDLARRLLEALARPRASTTRALAAELAVSERAGMVTLRGTVRSLHQRRVAVEIARAVRGVRAVEDELVADMIDVRVADTWLTVSGQVEPRGVRGGLRTSSRGRHHQQDPGRHGGLMRRHGREPPLGVVGGALVDLPVIAIRLDAGG